MEFETIGYSVDYYLNKRYLFSKSIEKKDREIFGYYGRKTHLATEEIKVKNKRIVRGQEYQTFLYPLCGKLIKK